MSSSGLGELDLVGDGVDQNCDGIDGQDVDGDGVPSLNSGGSDCDDEDPGAYPGAPEVAGDGVDQDCDGQDLTPYAGAWPVNACEVPPVATGGTEVGDVVADFALLDQFGDQIRLSSFCGDVIVLHVASGVDTQTPAALDEMQALWLSHPATDPLMLLTLWQDGGDGAPITDPGTLAWVADTYGLTYPQLSDPDRSNSDYIVAGVGSFSLPSYVVLSPGLEIAVYDSRLPVDLVDLLVTQLKSE